MIEVPRSQVGVQVHKLCLVWALGVLASPCWAQSQPNPAAELQRQDRQLQELRQRLDTTAPRTKTVDDTEEPPSAQTFAELNDDTPCFLIQHVEVRSPWPIPHVDGVLAGPLAQDPPQGRCLGGQGITLLVQRLQQALIEQGAITSQVQVPEQDLTLGNLLLTVEAGKVARIRQTPENSTALPPNALAIQAGQVFNLRDLEQTVDNLQRLPSVRAQVQIEPGEAPSTSDIVFDLQAQRPLRVAVHVDDSGNRSTGKLQGNITTSWDNPLGLADLLYLSLTQGIGQKEDGPRGNRSQVLHYSMPWGYWLFSLTSSQSDYQQTIQGAFSDYLYQGTSSQHELAVQRLLQRNTLSKTTATLKTFQRQSKNYIADLEVLVQRRKTAGWSLGVNHEHMLERGTLNTDLTYTRGTGAWGALPNPESASTEETDRAHVVKGQVAWTMPLQLKRPVNYQTQFQWQWSQSPLAPQDQFCIAGRSTVRGFNGQTTLCGERGQLWRQEWNTPLPNSAWTSPNVQSFVALDVGRAYTANLGTLPVQRLVGMAVGLRGQHTLYSKPTQWECFVGQPLHKPDDMNAPAYTAGFSFNIEF